MHPVMLSPPPASFPGSRRQLALAYESYNITSYQRRTDGLVTVYRPQPYAGGSFRLDWEAAGLTSSGSGVRVYWDTRPLGKVLLVVMV